MKIFEAAEYILENQTQYHLTFIKSASLLILANQRCCSEEALKLATDYIANNPANYPTQFLIETALTIIKTHRDFFRTPLKTRQAQQDFVNFFQERGAMESLTDYSNALVNLLRSTDERFKGGFKIEEWDNKLNQKVKKTLTIEGMWIDGYFRRVLEANVAIAIFILQNLRHEAIKIWNSPGNPLIRSNQ